MRKLMITKNSNLVTNHESRPIKSNPAMYFQTTDVTLTFSWLNLQEMTVDINHHMISTSNLL